MKRISGCRFCNIAYGGEMAFRKENTKIAESNKYFAISSVGALVEGWTLVIPKKHSCSMKNVYADKDFVEFTNEMVQILQKQYGHIIAFEHGPNREGSETSCGTDHAHIHLVPYHSLLKSLAKTNLEWQDCATTEISNQVGNSEYLFYCEPSDGWQNPLGKLHILQTPISQFFRKMIAIDQGNEEKYNYKINPDLTFTLKTIKTLKSCSFES